MRVTDDAYDSFVGKLFQAYPEFRLLRPFLARSGQLPGLAFECLAHELTQTALHSPEATVTASKLRWWGEELERTAAGDARHPVAQQLVLPARSTASSARLVSTLLDAASAWRDAPPSVDCSGQLALAEPFFRGLAALESEWTGASPGSLHARARVRALSLLTRELARLPFDDVRGPQALPMQLLARHQLTQADLGSTSTARDAAVVEQLTAIHQALERLRADIPEAGWVYQVRWHCELSRSRRLANRRDPLEQIWARLDRAPMATVWHAWRGARAAPRQRVT